MLPCALAILLSCGSSPFVAARPWADDAPTESMPAPAEGYVEESTEPETAPDFSLRPLDDDPDLLPDDVTRIDQPFLGEEMPTNYIGDFAWHWVPEGLIYHSYMAGVHEPRMALFSFSDLDGGVYWDATLGGRVGIVQYGNGDPVSPAGYQLDFYGAAIPRLDVQSQQDLESTDYVFGFPFTWGDDQWQWKVGYAHISSHMGDEYALNNPGALNDRINYVRDSLVVGTSYYVVPAWRLYGETGFAFHRSDGPARSMPNSAPRFRPPARRAPTGFRTWRRTAASAAMMDSTAT